jgi:hypothetical protein
VALFLNYSADEFAAATVCILVVAHYLLLHIARRASRVLSAFILSSALLARVEDEMEMTSFG